MKNEQLVKDAQYMVVGNTSPIHFFAHGDVVTYTGERSPMGSPRFIDDEGFSQSVSLDDLIVHVEEGKTYKLIGNGGTYAKVGEEVTAFLTDERDNQHLYITSVGPQFIFIEDVSPIGEAEDTSGGFRVGDLVRIVSGGDEYPLYGISNGTIATVVSTTDTHKDGNIRVRSVENFYVGYATADKLELATEESPKATFKVGDKVRLIANTSCSVNSIGDVGTVIEIDDRSARVQVEGNIDWSNWSPFSNLELVAPPAVEQVLAEGAYIRILPAWADERSMCDVEIGDVYEVLVDCDGDFYFLDEVDDERDLAQDDVGHEFEIVEGPPVAQKLELGNHIRILSGWRDERNPADVTIGKLYEVRVHDNGIYYFLDDLLDIRFLNGGDEIGKEYTIVRVVDVFPEEEKPEAKQEVELGYDATGKDVNGNTLEIGDIIRINPGAHRCEDIAGELRQIRDVYGYGSGGNVHFVGGGLTLGRYTTLVGKAFKG